MRIITISREFGSGGRELGKRMADIVGFDYYDSEIISAVAKKSGLDSHYVENTLRDHGWRNQPISFRGTLHSSAYVQSSKIDLLLDQKKVIEEIASFGKDCVIVVRNADVILQEYHPFNLFVCADVQARIRRCREMAGEGENLTDKELLRKMKQIDKIRSQTRVLISASEWGMPDAYHLTVNTSDWDIRELAFAVAKYAECWFGRKQ